jgi:site-specific recombinase XerD
MPILSDYKDVQDFISYLRLKNLSQRTIREYQWVLHDFLSFCSTEIQAPREATFDNLRDYIAGLQARRLSSKTIGDRVKILKQFFGYLYIEERIPSDPRKRSCFLPLYPIIQEPVAATGCFST